MIAVDTPCLYYEPWIPNRRELEVTDVSLRRKHRIPHSDEDQYSSTAGRDHPQSQISPKSEQDQASDNFHYMSPEKKWEHIWLWKNMVIWPSAYMAHGDVSHLVIIKYSNMGEGGWVFCKAVWRREEGFTLIFCIQAVIYSQTFDQYLKKWWQTPGIVEQSVFVTSGY